MENKDLALTQACFSYVPPFSGHCLPVLSRGGLGSLRVRPSLELTRLPWTLFLCPLGPGSLLCSVRWACLTPAVYSCTWKGQYGGVTISNDKDAREGPGEMA